MVWRLVLIVPKRKIRFCIGDDRNGGYYLEIVADDLYGLIFAFAVNDVLDRNIIPFDDIQHGEYAFTHGNFTSTELGFEVVNWRYDLT